MPILTAVDELAQIKDESTKINAVEVSRLYGSME